VVEAGDHDDPIDAVIQGCPYLAVIRLIEALDFRASGLQRSHGGVCELPLADQQDIAATRTVVGTIRGSAPILRGPGRGIVACPLSHET
jgi:hypothetical protein